MLFKGIRTHYFYLMSKKAIAWIIGFMSLSLIGLIAFQWYWIELSVKEKAEEFDRDIMKALENTKSAIEKQEAKVFITQQIQLLKQDSTQLKTSWQNSSQLEIISDFSLKQPNKEIFKTIQSKIKEIRKTDFNSGIIVLTEEEAISVDQETDKEQQKVTLIKRFQERKNELTEAVEEMAFEFAFGQLELEERLSKVNIDSIIKSSLSTVGLEEMNYKYALYKQENDSLISGEQLDEQSANLYMQDKLFNASENQGHLKLAVINKASFIIESLWVLLLISALLTLIMVGTFVYTLTAILRQKKVSTIKSDFINNMTHEFKTPIATISLAVDSILHPKILSNKSEIERFSKLIKKENERMNWQVEQVLQAAQFEKGELKLRSEEINVKLLLKELVDQFLLNKKSNQSFISLETNATKHILYGDPIHLYNCFRNLIENAIKYSTHPYKIFVRTYNEEGFLVVEIEDYGLGMDQATQKRAFDRFYRKESGNIHNTKGFGLGLSYVKSILDYIGGQIEIQSELGSGSTFRIRIPQKDVE